MRIVVALPIVVAGLVLGAGNADALQLAGFDVVRDLPQLGAWGPIAIIGLRLLAALAGVIPSSPVLLAAGATQGIVLGSLYVLIGAELGALITFLTARHLGRDYIARKDWMGGLAKTKFGGWLLEENASQPRLMAAVFYCRLIPGVNLDGLSYVAGVTPIATWRFCLATFGALLPYTVLLVAIGRQLVKLGPTELLGVLLALLAISAVPMALRYIHMKSSNPADS
jgi:uncharacterized membrane protein YdjX (TVP38/TMEM64 family)